MLTLKNLMCQYWPVCESILQNLSASDSSMILAIIDYKLHDTMEIKYLNPLRDIYQDPKDIQHVMNVSRFFFFVGPDVPLLIERIKQPNRYLTEFTYNKKLEISIIVVPREHGTSSYQDKNRTVTCRCPHTFMPGTWYSTSEMTTFYTGDYICELCTGFTDIVVPFPSTIEKCYNNSIQVRAKTVTSVKQVKGILTKHAPCCPFDCISVHLRELRITNYINFKFNPFIVKKVNATTHV